MDDQLNVGGGQFGQALGGMDALRSAMQKRGMDPAMLERVSGSAPMQQSLPGGAPDNNVMTQAPQAPQAPESTPRSAEMEIALKALADTVKSENKIAQAALGMR